MSQSLINKLILCIIFCICHCFYLRGQEIGFQHITTENGLSQSHISGILKDHEGFMWFSTFNGLNRYDGYNIEVYVNNPDDTTSLSASFIFSIYEDRKGNLWIGTAGYGLNLYDRENDSFKRFVYDENNPNGIQAFSIFSIVEDGNGNIWCGTDQGLEILDIETMTFRHYRYTSEDENSLGSNEITKIIKDKENNLWILSDYVLSKYVPRLDGFERYYPFGEENQKTRMLSFFAEGGGQLLIGTKGEGLFEYDALNDQLKLFQKLKNQNITTITINKEKDLLIGTEFNGLFKQKSGTADWKNYCNHWRDKSSLNNNSVQEIYIDKDDMTWIGTHSGGVNYFSKYDKSFSVLNRNTLGEEADDNILSLSVTKDSILWIGTDGGGLFQLDLTNNQLDKYLPKNNPYTLLDNVITSLYADESNLWIGTYVGGLHQMDLRTKEIINQKSNSTLSQLNGFIKHISEANERLYIGSYGISIYDDKNQKIDSVININYSFHLYEDSKKDLWICTSKGLIWVQPDAIDTFSVHTGNKPRISANTTNCVFEDSQSNIWVGTNNGLNLFDKESRTFKHYSIKEEFLNLEIKSILEDEKGNLWLSSSKGIIEVIDAVDLTKKPFTKVYDVEDGLPSNEFNGNVSVTLPNGQFAFGSIKGICIFDPDEIIDNPHTPKVVFTEFKIFNKPVEISTDGPLKKHISTIEELVLSYKHSVFSFEFTALSYLNSEQNEYAYRLVGFDEDWNYVGTRNNATYTNINDGTYTLEVIASNNDGIWNKTPASLQIIITPPWWETTWFKVLFLLTFFMTIGLFFRLRIRDIHRQKKILTQTVENRTKELNDANKELEKRAQKLSEADEAKSRFFSNITHEFRTPLTLIIGPLEKMIISVEQKSNKKHFELMLRNAQRLLRLINQLLDISKVETGNLPLEIAHGDIILHINKIAQSFIYLSERYKINYNYYSNVPSKMAYFDRDKVEKIVYNLLSNAFKFTPEGGKIEVSLTVDPKTERILSVKVQDSGQGISSENLSKIYERFYQVENTHITDNGSGIGLALTKRLVELHRGSIDVSSNTKKDKSGTTFCVELPITREAFDSNQYVTDFVDNEDRKLNFPLWSDEPEIVDNAKSKEGFIILVVEDNEDVMNYIKDELSVSYKIETAVNGEEGWQKALRIIPDLIISDWMMPKMDGVELCKKLKTTELTGHIPFILLTAKSSIDAKLEGLDIGADDYITKPFNVLYLQARVKNLVASRQQLKKKFEKQLSLDPKDIAVTSADELFLKKSLEIIDDSIDKPELDVNEFAKLLGVSRTQLYRKFQGLTGQSVKEFIRIYKLKHAANLLKKKEFTVSQVAFMVGYQSHSNFSRAFQKQFGRSPKSFIDLSH